MLGSSIQIQYNRPYTPSCTLQILVKDNNNYFYTRNPSIKFVKLYAAKNIMYETFEFVRIEKALAVSSECKVVKLEVFIIIITIVTFSTFY